MSGATIRIRTAISVSASKWGHLWFLLVPVRSYSGKMIDPSTVGLPGLSAKGDVVLVTDPTSNKDEELLKADLDALPPVDTPTPRCEGMSEHPNAAHERDRFRQGLLTPTSSPLATHLSHGLAYTVGSALGSTPPSQETCLQSFLSTNSVGLTAGARAWSKHAHRSGSGSGNNTTEGSESDQAASAKSKGWWGSPSGPVTRINDRALELFWRVMKDATWRNLHWLPHSVLVYEVRVLEGYGMRWSQDRSVASSLRSNAEKQDSVANKDGQDEIGLSDPSGEDERMLDGRPWIFRGFVEPMMENGHECGWRH
ncbi:hypothetical protein EIP91_006809 [Steccherinum ochraceum]|uniref:Uncharacterized protein n=1 Tax=Steccherinum ochraceum TaxID=92696 RepID=A0A4R0RFQ3_9APHY|nr:hypothetical protein EIP91_006809 [Steccherinum ochraceum]